MTGLLFDESEIEPEWALHWRQMPEYVCEDLRPVRQIIVSFATSDEIVQFSEAIGQKITAATQSVWFKPQPIGTYKDKSYE